MSEKKTEQYKSLLRDEIVIDIVCNNFNNKYWWDIKNYRDFGIYILYPDKNFKTRKACVENFKAIAELNGWKNYYIEKKTVR